MSHRCESLEYHFAIAVSAVLFRVRPPPATIPGKAITERRIGFWMGNKSDPVTSRNFHEKLLKIVYGIGVAVLLAQIGFGVWCDFTMDAIIRIPLFPSRLCWANDWSLLQMMAKKIPAIRFSKMKHVCVAVLVAFTFITPSRAIGPEKNPAEAVRNFYAWYVHEVANGSRPLEKEREQMRKFVTEGLLSRINKMPKGPGGLDGDFFLNAQEVDPEWGKNVAVSNYYVGKTMSKLGVILTGRKLGDRQFEVKVLFQEGAWKIDEVKFSD
jgi:hypothetical protein